MQHSATSDELSTYTVEISICATVNHTHTLMMRGVCSSVGWFGEIWPSPARSLIHSILQRSYQWGREH